METNLIQQLTVTFEGHAQQTDRWQAKFTRVIPMFPTLRPFLDEAYFCPDADKKWVVPILGGNPEGNLGTPF